VIISNSPEGGWSAAGLVVSGQGSVRDEYASQVGNLSGLERCLEWVWHFAGDHGLGDFDVHKAWIQMLGPSAGPG
jgi:hypothetical protein